jgi:monoamine oxidase
MLTKRQLLQYVGSAAGAAGVYRTMAALGMLGASSLTGCSSTSAVSQSMGDGKRVVILGAGIAGLVAAYELDMLGYECTVLEATARAGGRNLTVRGGDVMEEERKGRQQVDFDADDDLYANMGPARIPYHHQTMLGYCKEFGVSLEVFVNDNRGAFFQSPGSFGGQRVEGRRLHADQRGYIAELLAKAVNRKALDQELTEEDKANLLNMLQDFGGLQADHTYGGSGRAGHKGAYVHKGLGGAEPVEPLGLRQVLEGLKAPPLQGDDLWWLMLHWGHGLDQQATMFQPVGGMDRIVQAFETRVGHLIRYNSVVEEISNQSEGGVRIAYSQQGVMLEPVAADFAVCTIPLTVLKDIPNNFSKETQDTIAAVPYDTAVKIAFQGKYRFWEEDDHIYGGISWTRPGDVMQIWYPSNGYHRRKGIIMGAYILGVSGIDRDASLRFADMSYSSRLDAAIQAGERIHPGYGLKVEKGVSRAWSEVAFQKGSWPDFGMVPVEHLKEPDGAVYFAGDHTSDLSGWQEGAALSALAAVEAVQMRTANGA